ncbi:uncharacterized protein IL334_007676 [Kwoniella shivajii]|uniref:Uncharacterized protein n=1 Tax=Kwoniella shivajii TaxID=564305 RepID=A0ABZ1DA63_9TREE|nr:hypothetical protein IL334_007676 [Kwoniella shivajii]
MTIHTLDIPSLPPHPDVVSKGTVHVPISPISVWPVDNIPSLYTFPAELDVDKLKRAIQLLSTVFPSIAGRFEKRKKDDKDEDENRIGIGIESGSEFYFNLTQSPIPLEIQSLTISGPPFPSKRVIQETLEPYLPDLGMEYVRAGTDRPLFKIRYTTLLPSRESILGFSWAHILGDAAASLTALKWLESFYVNDIKAFDSSNSQFALPNYGPHVTLPPLPNGGGITLKNQSQFEGYPVDQRSNMYSESRKGSERIDITLSQHEIDIRKNQVVSIQRERGGEDTNLILSSQDIISGWVITLLRRAGHVINGVIYVCDFRRFCQSHPSIPSTLPYLVGNIAQMRQISLPPASSNADPPDEEMKDISRDIYEIAKTIRKEIIELRENPDILLPWLSTIAGNLVQSAEQGKGQFVIPDQGEIMVNSHIRANWHLSFGFPEDQTAFHNFYSNVRFLRIYQSNPIPGENPPIRRIELTINVPKDMKWVVDDLVGKDKKKWNEVK